MFVEGYGPIWQISRNGRRRLGRTTREGEARITIRIAENTPRLHLSVAFVAAELADQHQVFVMRSKDVILARSNRSFVIYGIVNEQLAHGNWRAELPTNSFTADMHCIRIWHGQVHIA
jgi:hypothetical protein